MATRKTFSRGLAAVAAVVGLSTALAPAAHAEKFRLTLSGVFNGTTDNPTTGMGNPVITETLNAGPGGANILTTPNERFTLTGVFDSSSPNLIAGLPVPLNRGWVDYAPLSVTLTVGVSTYSVATYDGSIPVTGGPGLTVAIFGDTTIYSPAPPPFSHFAAGFIQNPVQDGAGIVGDWTDLSPGYTIPNLVTTTYPTSDFYGVGFGNGVCSGGPGSGVGCVTTPIPLDGGLYELTLGGYDLNNPLNSTDDPTHGPYPNPIDPSYFFSAQLTAIPEPSTWALLLVGFAGLAAARFRSVRYARLTA